MDSNSRHQFLKRLQTGLAYGAPFDLSTLARVGVSAALAARYAGSGWLARLAQSVCAFPRDDFGVNGALRFLQQRGPGLHIGGKSARALHGVRRNLGGRDPLVLFWATCASPCPTLSSHALPNATCTRGCLTSRMGRLSMGFSTACYALPPTTV
jgi:hypothetical protein